MHTEPASDIQKITASIPRHLLQAAQEATGMGITDTIRLGLEQVTQKHTYSNLLELYGSYNFPISLNELRKDR